MTQIFKYVIISLGITLLIHFFNKTEYLVFPYVPGLSCLRFLATQRDYNITTSFISSLSSLYYYYFLRISHLINIHIQKPCKKCGGNREKVCDVCQRSSIKDYKRRNSTEKCRVLESAETFVQEEEGDSLLNQL